MFNSWPYPKLNCFFFPFFLELGRARTQALPMPALTRATCTKQGERSKTSLFTEKVRSNIIHCFHYHPSGYTLAVLLKFPVPFTTSADLICCYLFQPLLAGPHPQICSSKTLLPRSPPRKEPVALPSPLTCHFWASVPSKPKIPQKNLSVIFWYL